MERMTENASSDEARHRRDARLRRLIESKADAAQWIAQAVDCLRESALDGAVSVLTAFRDHQGVEAAGEHTNIALAFLHDLQRQTLFGRDVACKTEWDDAHKTVAAAATLLKDDLLPTLHTGLSHLLKV